MEKYQANCQGCRIGYKDGEIIIRPHQYYREIPQYPGSHGICPDCLSLYRKELIQSKLEEAVQTNES